jgi:hypothetical protein
MKQKYSKNLLWNVREVKQKLSFLLVIYSIVILLHVLDSPITNMLKGENRTPTGLFVKFHVIYT